MITLLEEPEIIYDLKNEFTSESYIIDGANFIFNLNGNPFKCPSFKFKLVKDNLGTIQEAFLIFEFIPSKDVVRISSVTGIDELIKRKLEKFIKSFLVLKKNHKVSLVLQMKSNILINKINPFFEGENKPETIFDINDENNNSIVLNFSNYEIFEVIF